MSADEAEHETGVVMINSFGNFCDITTLAPGLEEVVLTGPSHILIGNERAYQVAAYEARGWRLITTTMMPFGGNIYQTLTFRQEVPAKMVTLTQIIDGNRSDYDWPHRPVQVAIGEIASVGGALL